MEDQNIRGNIKTIFSRFTVTGRREKSGTFPDDGSILKKTE